MSVSEFDKGWILGFIEGEGFFTYQLQGGYVPKNGKAVYVPSFGVNQTNKTPLEFIMSFFGGGHIYKRSYQGKKYWSNEKGTRYDYLVRDATTLEKIRDFCDGKLKHPSRRTQFETWKKLFNNFVGEVKQREMAREQMKKRWENPEYRAKVLNNLRPSWDAKLRSETMKKLWADPKYRETMLNARSDSRRRRRSGQGS